MDPAPTSSNTPDRKAAILVAAAAVVSVAWVSTVSWAVSYDQPTSFTSVAQGDLEIADLQALAPREVESIGKELCAELTGSDATPAVEVTTLAGQVASRYEVSRPTGEALLDAARTHLCPEATAAAAAGTAA